MSRSAPHSLCYTTLPVAARDGAIEFAWPDLNLAADAVAFDGELGARHHPVVQAMRIVGWLAFGQSLLFLVIWLLICASAGAAPAPQKKAEFKPELQISTYAPTKARDPFTEVGATTGPAVPTVSLQLEGIIYSPSDPAAIVNGQLLPLNKVVYLTQGNGELQLKAVEITRDRVTVAVGNQKVVLFLNQQSQAPPLLK